MWKIAPTQWWFRSRESGRLNLVSYWLFAAFCAVPVYFLAGFSFEMASAADENDWITGRHPEALRAAAGPGSPFLDVRDRLLSALQDQNSVSSAPLWSAKDLKAGKSNCAPVAESFHKPEIKVYPHCVTFAPAPPEPGSTAPMDVARPPAKIAGAAPVNGAPPNDDISLRRDERLVFGHFATFMTDMFKRQLDHCTDAQNHTERCLASALALIPQGTGRDPLDVPWIYVASEEGAIAVFPGTDVLAEGWVTKSRPWYQAIFPPLPGQFAALSSDAPDPKDRLSVTYLDILAESSILVRTYLRSFHVGTRSFVLGIDLKRRREFLGGSVSPAEPGSLWTGLPWMVRIAVVLVLSFGALVVLRWISSAKTYCFSFTRLPHAMYGMIEVKDKVGMFASVEESDTFKAGFGGGDYVWVKGEHAVEQKEGNKGETVAERSRPLLRGQEYWNVTYTTRISWQLCRLRFESTANRHIGRIELAYTRAILPEARWDSLPPGPFSRETEELYKHKLPEILRRNADSADNGRIEVPASMDEFMPISAPQVPAWAQSIINSQELLAIRQRRAYVTLNGANLEDMYVRADSVRAVILQNYLERLLEHGQADFLSKGRIVHRLVVFPGPDAQLRLTDKSAHVYQQLLGGFSPPARIIRRVDYPGSFKGLVPVYDFAIIKDGDGERVFVAHGVSETSVVDIASPQRTTQRYRIEGYLSWRTADVKFYSALFDWLAEQATEMDQLQDRMVAAPGAA